MVTWVIKIFLCTILQCSLAPSSNFFCLCSLLTISVINHAHFCMKCSFDSSNFLEEISNGLTFYCFSLFLSIFHLERPSYLSLLFSDTLHLVEYIFPFLTCLSQLFFLQLFVKSLQITTLPSGISSSLALFWSLPLV